MSDRNRDRLIEGILFYKKEIKIIKERNDENVIDPSTSLNILTRIASALIEPDITPVKAMTEEESKEWDFLKTR